MTTADLPDLVARLTALGSVVSPEGPGFTELDHALQCAFELSVTHPEDLELQVAGLVHDIGHQPGDDDAHGRLGAELVRPALGDRVADLVGAHVPAKRYLVAVDPGYALSSVSVASLAAQGGALLPADRRAFESSPHFADAVALRRADDAAKTPGRPVPPLEAWTSVLERVASVSRSAGRAR